MNKPITEVLTELAISEDADTALIIAGCINLYSESLRRKHGRILYTAADARRLLEMCSLVLDSPEPLEVRPVRSTLNEEEREQVLTGVADAIQSKGTPPVVRRH